MSIELNDTIGSIFLETAEALTFMFGDPIDADSVPHINTEWSQTRIHFEGRHNGNLSLTIPTNVCGEIAANIMGMDEDEISESVSQDALKELLNVVSGHIVPSIQGEDNDFVLSVPTLSKLDGDACYVMKENSGTTCFNLDGNPVILGIELED